MNDVTGNEAVEEKSKWVLSDKCDNCTTKDGCEEYNPLFIVYCCTKHQQPATPQPCCEAAVKAEREQARTRESVLIKFAESCAGCYGREDGICNDCEIKKKALSADGQAYAERIKRLEAVVEAARNATGDKIAIIPALCELRKALAAMEEPTHG